MQSERNAVIVARFEPRHLFFNRRKIRRLICKALLLKKLAKLSLGRAPLELGEPTFTKLPPQFGDPLIDSHRYHQALLRCDERRRATRRRGPAQGSTQPTASGTARP
jgi:hypothetical protein